MLLQRGKLLEEILHNFLEKIRKNPKKSQTKSQKSQKIQNNPKSLYAFFQSYLPLGCCKYYYINSLTNSCKIDRNIIVFTTFRTTLQTVVLITRKAYISPGLLLTSLLAMCLYIFWSPVFTIKQDDNTHTLFRLTLYRTNEYQGHQENKYFLCTLLY